MDLPHRQLDSSRISGGARRNAAILVTGAGGEMGHGLLEVLARERDAAEGAFPAVVAIDLRELDSERKGLCDEAFSGDVTDSALLSRLLAQYEISEIYHLAAILSTRSEFVPETAHAVNVGGTINLFRLAVEEARSNGQAVKFFFPSSIATYGFPDLAEEAFLRFHLRRGVAPTAHDVRMQQTQWRAPWQVLLSPLPQTRFGPYPAANRFSFDSIPRDHFC